MPFVQRTLAGQVTGVYANRQPGYAEEELTDTHPEVVAFRTPKPVPPSGLAVALDAALSGPSPTAGQIKAVFQIWRQSVT